MECADYLFYGQPNYFYYDKGRFFFFQLFCRENRLSTKRNSWPFQAQNVRTVKNFIFFSYGDATYFFCDEEKIFSFRVFRLGGALYRFCVENKFLFPRQKYRTKARKREKRQVTEGPNWIQGTGCKAENKNTKRHANLRFTELEKSRCQCLLCFFFHCTKAVLLWNRWGESMQQQNLPPVERRRQYT